VQAYCFRLCLTTADDRIPIAPPPDYDPKQYELVARFISACQAIGDDMDLRWFSKYDPLPNGKWDFNTATFGGNLPGASWEWPEASSARREQIAQAHENYHRGLLHFLATDPRVPAKVRAEMNRFGLPRDEFTDNGGWPHQLYLREARRMVSDLVMTEHHTHGRELAPNPVGLGSYGTDTHEVRRIVKDGVVTREGKTAGGRGGAGPYPIGYAAIVPRLGECENLFVTFALSASHTAFSSIRMEPVFMITSQSAGAAACLALEDAVPVQKVDYRKLQTRLLEAGQVLAAPPSTTPRTESGAAAMAVVDPAAVVAVSPLAPKGTKPALPTPGPAEPGQLGARGFFPSYDGPPGALLTATFARAWAEDLVALRTFQWVHVPVGSRESKPEEERALLERARLSGRNLVQYAPQILRDHIGSPARETAEEADGAKPTLEDLVDYDAIAYCEKEADDSITLEEVRAATSRIKDSMARVVIEEERRERF
jgi:hypothetical protein